MLERVTDPEILKKLNGDSQYEKVTDPALLNKLNSTNESVEPQEKLDPNIIKRVPGALKNVASDVGDFASNLPTNIITGLMGLPSKAINVAQGVPDVIGQAVYEPDRALRNVGAGLADIGHAELNAPRGVAEYLAKIGMISPESVQKVPVQKDISNDLSQFVGAGQHPGDIGIRGTVGAIPNIITAAEVGGMVNPMKLSYKNLAKDVLKKEKMAKEKYSGKNGLYNQLSDEAKNRGITGQHIAPSQADLTVLAEHMPEDEYVAIDKLMKDKNITNAQNAISQLGHRERKLIGKSNRGDILTDPEKDLLKAVKNTKNHIQENMFKDNNGKVHSDLVAKHKVIQQGYANEVIPYTKNPAIQAFKKNEKLPEEMIRSISKGKFAAKRGSAHKAIKARNLINSATGSKLSQGALLATGLAGAGSILKSLMGG